MSITPYHKSHIRYYNGNIYTLGSLSPGGDNIGIAVNGGKFVQASAIQEVKVLWFRYGDTMLMSYSCK